jgi:hypothetical protein
LKLEEAMKKVTALLLALSQASVAWAATAVPFSPLWAGLMDNNNLMELCFLIGAIHLTIAHGWRAWLLRRKWQALAHRKPRLHELLVALANEIIPKESIKSMMKALAPGCRCSRFNLRSAQKAWSRLCRPWRNAAGT